MSISTLDPNHKLASLYRIGGIAAVLSTILIPISIIAYFIWPTFPGSAVEIFAIIQRDRLAGLMSLDFPYLFGNIFGIPLFIVLYVTLKRTSESLSVIALGLGFIALISLIPARPIVEMFVLSDQYAGATTDVQRSQFAAAGEAILALFHGTAFQVHYLLGSASLLLSSIIMLRSPIFSKATAVVGIVTNTLVFGLYVPEIGVYISILSVFPFMVIWNIQIARRLFRLAITPENH
jgi:hypothetical protein